MSSELRRADPGVTTPWWRDLVIPVVAYCSIAAVLTFLQYAAQPGGHGLDDVWIRYDAGAYLTVAQSGYSWSPADPYPLVAWFPGYPLVIRLVSVVVRDGVLAAVLITFTSGLVSSCLLWRWMATVAVRGRDRLLGLAALLLFAWGWYLYGVVYGDALFLALALGSFLSLERGRLLLATAFALVATAERPTGVALTLGLLVAVMEHDEVIRWRGWRPDDGGLQSPVQVNRGRLRPRQLVPLLSLAGVIAYSVYLGDRFGRPLLWLEAQGKWSQGPVAGPASWFKLHMAAMVIKEHDPAYLAKSLTQLVAVIAVIVVVPAVRRRLGLGYAAYVGAIVGIVAIGTNDFVGPGRYLIGVFPVAVLIGEWLGRHRRSAIAWLVVSGTALATQTVLFARDVYLS